jgi:hypothetical protein
MQQQQKKKKNEFTLGICRKPTYTDTLIPESFNHLSNHKQAAFNYLLDKSTQNAYYQG